MRQVLLLPSGNDIRIKDVMNKDPITIGPEENLEEAARRIYQYKIGGLPVLEDGRLVGIVTVGDILAAFIEIMGVLQASSRIDIQLGDDPEAFESVSRIIKKKGGDIISVGMGDVHGSDKKCYFFRLNKCDVDVIAESLRQNGFDVISVIQ